MALDPLKFVKVVEGEPVGRYVVERPHLSEAEEKVLDVLTGVLSGKKSLNDSNLSFLGERADDFVLLLRDTVSKIPPKKLFSPSELLSIAGDVFETLKVVGIGNEYVSIKSVYDGLGLGDLEFLLYDPDLEEIMVNGRNRPVFVYHVLHGHLETNVVVDPKTLARRLLRFLNARGPTADGRLPDGSRVNVVLDPVSDGGPSVNVRKFRRERLNLVEIMKRGTMTPEVAAYLWLLIEGMGVVPHNVIVSGNTGGGKTTTLNALIDLIPLSERIITIEDTRELSLVHPNWVALSSETDGVTLNDLLVNALRMRPDRIVVGEVRGEEAETLLAAMNVGHAGMGTLHANSARDTIRRLTSPPMNVPERMVSVLNLVVVQHRVRIPGKGLVRRVTQVVELVPLEGGVNVAEIFHWDPSKDEIRRTEIPSVLVDKMSEYLNLPKKRILRELENRRKILELALSQNLDRARLISLVNSYYLNPEKVLGALK